ncbi:hypothetical protein MKX03_032548 [Papaver bracteatum]|nr:hypothetical protein MKX03_032548 [Papaver bracteatum]
MGLLLRERIVFSGNQIDDVVDDAIISQLLLLDAQVPAKDIHIFINSPLVGFKCSMAIYDVLQLVRADVSTVALGIAAIILGGGTKGKHFAMPNRQIMLHQLLGGASGQAIIWKSRPKRLCTRTITSLLLSSASLLKLYNPEQVKSRFSCADIIEDPKKFLTPEIPDDEIF